MFWSTLFCYLWFCFVITQKKQCVYVPTHITLAKVVSMETIWDLDAEETKAFILTISAAYVGGALSSPGSRTVSIPAMQCVMDEDRNNYWHAAGAKTHTQLFTIAFILLLHKHQGHTQNNNSTHCSSVLICTHLCVWPTEFSWIFLFKYKGYKR